MSFLDLYTGRSIWTSLPFNYSIIGKDDSLFQKIKEKI